ncbi:folylpolyglutamate synthase, mitochondrial-like isoform X2 [Anoplophora glabripennis]|nr:folylpolyglutamate synthase, mitochondrial-like isoform X2 [Anoplophora glabripennis]
MAKYLNRCGISLEKLDDLSVIHVTGTHGKGSTCFYCESVLLSHGYNTGFYSSPHLLEVRERIRIGGKPLSKSAFSEHFWTVYDMLDGQKEDENDMPLYFPFLTILAFHIFLKSKIDVAIVEVGIGGEYDSTNVIRTPIAVGIAPISIDHTAILGATEESIAWHKGGIMKPGGVAFSVIQSEGILNVLEERSKERGCPLKILRKCLCTADVGSRIPVHVKETVATLAIALSEAIVKKRCDKDPNESRHFSLEMAIRSIENACWPGRYDIREIGNVRFFLDGAHTQISIKTTAEWFSGETKDSPHPKVLVFNLTGKRDSEVFLAELLICEFDVAIFIPNVGCEKDTADTANFKLTTETQLTLCVEYSEKWLGLQRRYGKKPSVVKVFPSFAKVLQFLGKTDRCDVLVTGSLYLVGAALSVLDPSLKGSLTDE